MMEMLSLFDPSFMEEQTQEAESLASAPVQVTKELDYDFLQEIERFQLSHQTLENELCFLSDYYERFQFERDRVRLETLKYYFDQHAS